MPKKQNPPKVYTDKNKFEQAKQMYNDSLNLFKFREKALLNHNGSKPPTNYQKYTIPEAKDAVYGRFGILDYTSDYLAGTPSQNKQLRSIVKRTGYLPIGRELIEGDIPVYKKPVQPVVYATHPITQMNRLDMSQPQQSQVNIQGQPIPLQMQLPKQTGTPVYGPGNTIIGYSNNMQFKPAYAYTGAPNNPSNLQDKALLNDPVAMRKYLLSKDNYKFATGGRNAPPTQEEWEEQNEDMNNTQEPSEYSEWQGTGNYDFNPYFKAFNTAAMGVTAFANAFSDAKNRREEEERYLKELLPKPKYNYNEQGLNNIPVYKDGGDRAKKMFKILRDGEVNGKPLTKKQKKFFFTMATKKYPDGGSPSIDDLKRRYDEVVYGGDGWNGKNLDPGFSMPSDPRFDNIDPGFSMPSDPRFDNIDPGFSMPSIYGPRFRPELDPTTIAFLQHAIYNKNAGDFIGAPTQEDWQQSIDNRPFIGPMPYEYSQEDGQGFTEQTSDKPYKAGKSDSEQRSVKKMPSSISFSEAFKQSRAKSGDGGIFEWRGKKYTTTLKGGSKTSKYTTPKKASATNQEVSPTTTSNPTRKIFIDPKNPNFAGRADDIWNNPNGSNNPNPQRPTSWKEDGVKPYVSKPSVSKPTFDPRYRTKLPQTELERRKIQKSRYYDDVYHGRIGEDISWTNQPWYPDALYTKYNNYDVNEFAVGGYNEGQEMDLTDAEIQDLQAQGYTIEYI